MQIYKSWIREALKPSFPIFSAVYSAHKNLWKLHNTAIICASSRAILIEARNKFWLQTGLLRVYKVASLWATNFSGCAHEPLSSETVLTAPNKEHEKTDAEIHIRCSAWWKNLISSCHGSLSSALLSFFIYSSPDSGRKEAEEEASPADGLDDCYWIPFINFRYENLCGQKIGRRCFRSRNTTLSVRRRLMNFIGMPAKREPGGSSCLASLLKILAVTDERSLCALDKRCTELVQPILAPSPEDSSQVAPRRWQLEFKRRSSSRRITSIPCNEILRLRNSSMAEEYSPRCCAENAGQWLCVSFHVHFSVHSPS